MMNNDNNYKDTSVSFSYVNAGEAANDTSGKSVSDDKFTLVQNDKKIHDVKFTTKPTTFLKDALNRFTKNQSSVIGGIILGILFALAIILPLAIPYDTTSVHNYETNLPCKLLPAGTGFWDGSRKLKNIAYPYETDSDGNDVTDDDGNLIYTGEYVDDSAILKIENKHNGYQDGSSESGKGGYAMINKFAAENQTGYMYSAANKFDLDTYNYNIAFTLGTRASDGYLEKPEWAVIARMGSTNYLLTDYTDDYGEALQNTNSEETVTAHETNTYSINTIVENMGLTSTLSNATYSIGLIFKSDASLKTALYVRDFEFTATNKDGTSAPRTVTSTLKKMSFGTENSSTADANALTLISYKAGDMSYWSTVTSERFKSVDTNTVVCDITYDWYQVTYGLRADMQVDFETMYNWKKKGLINYDFDATDPLSTYEITEAGQQDGSVFVTEVSEQKAQDLEYEDPDDGTTHKVYSFKCTVVMYKYLGYSSIPIHIFGTEYQGKDMLKYAFSGLRTSLILGFVVAAINILVGIVWGSISGYFGGTVDITMERITDILSGIPYIVLMTVLTLKLGQTFFVFALSLCLTGWIGTASTTRSQFYRYRGREYVLASRTLGAKSPRLIFLHILPNAIGTIVTGSVLMIPSVIFSEATISYLGLGLQSLDSLGVILSQNQKVLMNYPSQLVFPAVIISLLMICFNLFGNGLRDAFNPQLKGSD